MRRFYSSIASAVLAFVVSAGAEEKAGNPLDVLVRTLGKIENPAAQANILKGLNASLKGKRDVAAPAGWAELYEKLRTSDSNDVRQQAQALSAVFGGGAALDQMRSTLADPAAEAEARRAALDSLVAAKDAQSLPLLLEVAKQAGALRSAAIRGLASYDDPQIAPLLVKSYPSLGSAERQDAMNTLLARPTAARALIDAIAKDAIPRSAITAPLARQLQGLRDPEIDAWLSKNWGAVKTTSADKQAQIAKFKEFLDPTLIRQADASNGRAIFTQTCVVCHAMFGVGGKVGPELPGSFEDVDYLLQNILDPNAIIGKDYQQTFVTLKDGQALSGIVVSEDDSALTLKTLGEPVTVQRAEIAEVSVSEQSMMPEGLLNALDEESVRDLFAYLRQREQVPMRVTEMTAGDFFNGNDLSRWRASGGEWKAEGGAIIGRNSGKAPIALISDMVAGDFKLTSQIRLAGENAVGELALRGAADQKAFKGVSLSIGGASAPSLWKYGNDGPQSTSGNVPLQHGTWGKLEILARGPSVKVSINGAPAVEIADAGTSRTVFALYVAGDGAELAMKDVKVEPLPTR